MEKDGSKTPVERPESATPHSAGDGPAKKRRRRVFSCLSCQRLKCKCEFEANNKSCHRCKALRIPCSLASETQITSPPVEPSLPQNVEQRLATLEESLAQVQSLLDDINSAHISGGVRRKQDGLSTNSSSGSEESPHDSAYHKIHDIAHHASSSAPVAVVREIGRRYTGEPRQPLKLLEADLVDNQILDPSTANELILLFFQLQRHAFHLVSVGPMPSGEDIRAISPFLHSACCLNAMALCSSTVERNVHQAVYKRVRMCLGQVLLSSSLALEDIQALFILTDNHMTPFGSENDYVDSWMLTGYCVKQAMLSIDFTDIMNRIKQGQSHPNDRAATCLWSAICLSHLQWSATTARPSIIPDTYISQCHLLLSYSDATIQDEMRLAEILLYSTLLQNMGNRPTLTSRGECLNFDAWKQKWCHLLALPTASMLLISYNMACLTLVIRSLENLGEELSSDTFLQSSTPQADTHPSAHQSETRQHHRRSAAKYSLAVLQTFSTMPDTSTRSLGTNRCLCIVYSSIMLAHYHASLPEVSAEQCSSLLAKVDQWCSSIPGKPWAAKFSGLGQAILTERVAQNDPASVALPITRNSRLVRKLPTHAGPIQPSPVSMEGSTGAAEGLAEDSSIWSQTAFLSYGAEVENILPSMMGFFGGQYLD
ncbi:hypothetical protein B0I35DRAFT_112666 [Stachybotrys elegans]|uniref:Zn(2)-C6 fungal-type domain-containing protein n=1 Tax=Stachybotrys elegans TaxID=80388 RepID=A0A8K0WL09_9HYPO|nr:hypothetical protein B0I35DRAFT_112666 [Stachybotrys elegans]